MHLSTGFSTFELMCGHEVRGISGMPKERWLGDENFPSVGKVSYSKDRFMTARETEVENLKETQVNMNEWCDRRVRKFCAGDKVLEVFFPLQRLPWPGKPSDVNCQGNTLDKRKQSQLCHVNMVNIFMSRNGETKEDKRRKNMPK